MLNNTMASLDAWTVLKVTAILVPVLMLFWIVLTVTALHKRDIYFWKFSVQPGLVLSPVRWPWPLRL